MFVKIVLTEGNVTMRGRDSVEIVTREIVTGKEKNVHSVAGTKITRNGKNKENGGKTVFREEKAGKIETKGILPTGRTGARGENGVSSRGITGKSREKEMNSGEEHVLSGKSITGENVKRETTVSTG